MKSKQSTINLKQRFLMEQNPFYKTCALFGHFDHECDGKITWEHAIIAAGEKCQAEWAIVPLCAKAHAVNEFQDAGTMKKEVNEWIAYCRATNEDILALVGEGKGVDPNLSKARMHFQKKKYLLEKYGMWGPKTFKIPVTSEKRDEAIWKGRKLKELSREELYEAINDLSILYKQTLKELTF